MPLLFDNTEHAEAKTKQLLSKVNKLKVDLVNLNRHKPYIKEAEDLAVIDADHAEIAGACAELLAVMDAVEVLPDPNAGNEDPE